MCRVRLNRPSLLPSNSLSQVKFYGTASLEKILGFKLTHICPWLDVQWVYRFHPVNPCNSLCETSFTLPLFPRSLSCTPATELCSPIHHPSKTRRVEAKPDVWGLEVKGVRTTNPLLALSSLKVMSNMHRGDRSLQCTTQPLYKRDSTHRILLPRQAYIFTILSR